MGRALMFGNRIDKIYDTFMAKAQLTASTQKIKITAAPFQA
tara:strand:- start:2787 stop:2909 length:123 start_codon:yes stop_codon:yes gene_type:complete